MAKQENVTNEEEVVLSSDDFIDSNTSIEYKERMGNILKRMYPKQLKTRTEWLKIIDEILK